ncbi:hypothetical protein NQ318_010733 [Aromia moschata]|uniref:Uncharacterized protein n=1 Tax=Aromia moschata TaxID=1265417 RepID=A0AAV8YM50_9CUCU|nr:hypothetical protein NQ318_010733 [Aromia moschata]
MYGGHDFMGSFRVAIERDGLPNINAQDYDSADDWLQRQNTNAGRSCSPISRKISGVAADISRRATFKGLNKYGTCFASQSSRPPPRWPSHGHLEYGIPIRGRLEDGRVRLISETLDTTKTIVHEIVSESLGMRKVCAKLVPKVLTDDQKARRVETCQELLDTCEDNPAMLDDVITGDESCISSPRRAIESSRAPSTLEKELALYVFIADGNDVTNAGTWRYVKRTERRKETPADGLALNCHGVTKGLTAITIHFRASSAEELDDPRNNFLGVGREYEKNCCGS